jgi:hypothetical protein
MSQTNSSPKSSNKIAIFGTSAVAVVLLLLAVFVPISGQTVLSKSLDALGQHKTSTGLDFISKYGFNSKVQTLANIDPTNPDSCGNIWNTYKDTTLTNLFLGSPELKKTSSLFYGKVAPNGDLAKDVYAELSADIRSDSTNLSQPNVQTNIGLEVKANTQELYNKLRQVDSSLPAQELPKAQASLKLGSIIKDTQTFFKLEEFKLIEPAAMAFNIGFPSWYKADPSSVLTPNLGDDEYGKQMAADAQVTQNRQKEIQKSMNETLEKTPVSQYLSESSYKAFAKVACAGVQSVQFGPIAQQSFGKNGEVKASVRNVKIQLKPTILQDYVAATPDLLEALDKDQVFQAFIAKTEKDQEAIKAKYPYQSEFQQQLDKTAAKEPFDKAEVQKSVQEFVKAINENVKYTAQYDIQIDPASQLVYGSSYNFNIMPADIVPASVSSSTTKTDPAKLWFNKDLNKGISITGSSYDGKYGSQAKSIENVENPQDFGEFIKKISSDPNINKATSTLMPSQLDSSGSTMPAGSDFGGLTDEELMAQ